MPASRFTEPVGSDRELLTKLFEEYANDIDRRAAARHDRFIKDSQFKEAAQRSLVERLGVSREDVEKAVAQQRRSMHDQLRRETPSPFTPPKGTNPVRWAPFDASWSAISCGGITYCSLYGPDAGSGQIGADLGIFNGGGASAGSAVGFWLYSQAYGTLNIIGQASVWGRGYVFSALFGYASSYASLDLYVYGPGTANPSHAVGPIYDRGGVLEFDITSFDWVTRSTSISVPAQPGWYLVWVDANQDAYAGGLADSVSNFDMYVGPVWWWVT